MMPRAGFADTPKGKANVATTAIGLMAVTALNMPADRYGPGAAKFLTEHARTFEEIRIAAAGLESVQEKSPKGQAWLEEVLKMSNEGGSYGKGSRRSPGTPPASVVTVLRLGGSPKDKGLVFQGSQGWPASQWRLWQGETTKPSSDLESTYRVMRCFMMLKAQPDRVEGLRTFIAKCRNEDGGYGVAPGQPSRPSVPPISRPAFGTGLKNKIIFFKNIFLTGKEY